MVHDTYLYTLVFLQGGTQKLSAKKVQKLASCTGRVCISLLQCLCDAYFEPSQSLLQCGLVSVCCSVRLLHYCCLLLLLEGNVCGSTSLWKQNVLAQP